MPFGAVPIDHPIAPCAAGGVDHNQKRIVSERLGKYLYPCKLWPPRRHSAIRWTLPPMMAISGHDG
jgi:hypothetical protein